jgi:hypothetical protein
MLSEGPAGDLHVITNRTSETFKKLNDELLLPWRSHNADSYWDFRQSECSLYCCPFGGSSDSGHIASPKVQDHGVLGFLRNFVAGSQSFCSPFTVMNDPIGRTQPSLIQRVVVLGPFAVGSEVMCGNDDFDLVSPQVAYQLDRLWIIQLQLVQEMKMEDVDVLQSPSYRRLVSTREVLFDQKSTIEDSCESSGIMVSIVKIWNTDVDLNP